MGFGGGAVGGMFDCSDAKEVSVRGAFFWFNVAHVVSLVACACYVAGIILVWFLVGLLPLLLWVLLNFTFFLLQLVASGIHLIAMKRESGIMSAFTRCGVSAEGANTLGFYNLFAHLISCTLMWITQIGFLSIFLSYALSLVCLIIAFVHSRRN